MTLFIIAITAIVSVLAFNRRDLFDKLKFNAFYIHKEKQWYRFLSYGLVHADLMHLFVNMFVLYSFGSVVENEFHKLFDTKSIPYFTFLYIGGLAFSTLWDFGKNKDNIFYNAVGASGAVSAILFSSIILVPQGGIGFFFISIDIPSPIFGILYLVYSAYMAKRGTSNIGHSAHFWGSVFGVVFTIALKPELLSDFIDYLF